MRIPGRFIILLLVAVLSACSSLSASQPATLIPTETISSAVPSETSEPEVTSTAIEKRDPSDKVDAFYNPWYGNPGTGGKWIHCILQIDRGDLGKTQVTIFNFLGETPIAVKTVEGHQVTSGRNRPQIAIPIEWLTTPNR